MSGAGDRGVRGHGQYDDVDSFFFHNRSPSAAEGGGGGGGVAGNGYASITDDFLQGFLDDDGAKREMVGRQDDLLQMMAGGGAPPVTPNSSVMSSSSEAIDGDHRPKGSRLEEIDEQGSAADRNCKRKNSSGEEKKKKAGEKKPRVAFKTKSEVDHLEDGYRWRKYGQKAVKNSSYPRSYYRCTAARCGVKKLVERSQQDPSSVITTYEGQHTHPCPVGLARAGTARGLLLQHQPHGNLTMSPPMHHHQLGFVRPDDDLARMMIYAHGVPSSSPAAGTGGAMPPPPVKHLLRPDH